MSEIIGNGIYAKSKVTLEDQGKVVSNGSLISQISQTITQNGTYDTTLINELIANISGSGGSTNIFSGTDAPTANVGSDGDVYLRYLPANIKNTNTQYINTGYSGNSNSKYVIDFMLKDTQTSQYPSPFGARTDQNALSEASHVHVGYNGDYNQTWVSWGNWQTQAFNFGAASFIGKRVMIELSAGSAKITIDGEEHSITFTPSAITNTTPIGIFTMLTRGNLPTAFTTIVKDMYLFGFKIYESDVLVHDFIPALDGSDIPCVYDTITQEYKYNAGSGSFIYSEDDIFDAFCKANGTWQSLIGSDIDNVNKGNVIPAANGLRF